MPDTPTTNGRAGPTQRLLVCAHGATDDLRRGRFGGNAPLSHPHLTPPAGEPVDHWSCGPEPACQETLTRWGVTPAPVANLRGPDFGSWTGKTLDETAEADPDGLAGWLHDPDGGPPGGESLSELVDRLRPFAASISQHGWSGVVTTPLVARALVVAALDGSTALLAGIEVIPGGRALLTRPHPRATWRLRRLV